MILDTFNINNKFQMLYYMYNKSVSVNVCVHVFS